MRVNLVIPGRAMGMAIETTIKTIVDALAGLVQPQSDAIFAIGDRSEQHRLCAGDTGHVANRNWGGGKDPALHA